MGLGEVFYVDYWKLKAEATKRGLTMEKLANGIGRSAGYFSSNKNGKGIEHCHYRKPTILALKAIYNIDYDDIKGEPKRVNEPTPEPVHVTTLEPIDLREDIKALTDAVSKLGIIVKAAHEARFEHDQRMELMIKNALESETLYKSLFTPVFNAMRAAYNEPGRRIDGTPNYQNRR